MTVRVLSVTDTLRVGRVEVSLSIEEVEKLFPTVCVYAILSVSVFTQGERVWRHLAPLSREEKSSLIICLHLND